MPKRMERRGRKPIFTAEQKRALPALIAAGLRKEIRRLRRGPCQQG